MSYYIYSRVSTLEQYTSGHSIEAQCEAALRYVKSVGGTLGTETNSGLPGVFVDGGKSAFKKTLIQRAGGLKLLESLRPGDTVVATATHRLFRRMVDMVNTMEHWVEKGINIVFVDYPTLSTNTANGKAMLYIFSAIAQMKSELMSARLREAFALRKSKKAKLEVVPPVSIQYQLPDSLKDDIGSILQEVVREQEQNNFLFSGTIRAYVRVSTKDQTVEQQRVMIERHLPNHMKQANIVWYVDEGESAFRTSLGKRKAGGQMMKDMQPGDIVVTWRTDRIFRSLLDMSKMVDSIHKTGAYLHIVEGDLRTDSPMGKMMVSLISMMAEIESQDISRSTKQGFFTALASSEGLRAQRLPKMFKAVKDHHLLKHFNFSRFFNQEDRMWMMQQFYLIKGQFRDRRTAARAVSNQWLTRKGLPTITGEYGTTRGIYLSRLEAMQKEEYSERRDAAIRQLSSYSKDVIVQYPIDTNTLGKLDPHMKRFMMVARKFRGRIKDKSILVTMAASCSNPDDVVKLIHYVG